MGISLWSYFLFDKTFEGNNKNDVMLNEAGKIAILMRILEARPHANLHFDDFITELGMILLQIEARSQMTHVFENIVNF